MSAENPVININDHNFEQFRVFPRACLVIGSPKHCMPCHRYQPVIDLLAEKCPGVNFGLADLKEYWKYNPDNPFTKIKRHFDIKSIPLTAIMSADEDLEQFANARTQDFVLSKLEGHFGRDIYFTDTDYIEV